MGTGYSGHYKNTQGSLKPEHLMEELRNRGNKFTEEEVVMVTRTQKGELVWLEKGNDRKGLTHIIARHEEDLQRKFGVAKGEIPGLVKDVFTNGEELTSALKNGRLEKLYLYKEEYFVVSAVGSNGFIVTI